MYHLKYNSSDEGAKKLIRVLVAKSLAKIPSVTAAASSKSSTIDNVLSAVSITDG